MPGDNLWQPFTTTDPKAIARRSQRMMKMITSIFVSVFCLEFPCATVTTSENTLIMKSVNRANRYRDRHDLSSRSLDRWQVKVNNDQIHSVLKTSKTIIASASGHYRLQCNARRRLGFYTYVVGESRTKYSTVRRRRAQDGNSQTKKKKKTYARANEISERKVICFSI